MSISATGGDVREAYLLVRFGAEALTKVREAARVLIFASPAHGFEFFEEISDQVRTVPHDLAKIPVIGRRHRIEFMSAPSV
jgi:hypothetical protein